jgi:spermidine dehydrogenase
MNKHDRSLGMHRDITRRDFMNGVALTAGSLMTPLTALADSATPAAPPDDYPPSRTGMRGSHPGSFEAAHELRDRRSIDTSGARRLNETYDLVVVGGGISGLAAAYFFVKNAGREVKVLILDNHDDFGGHAKRNEFRYRDKLVVINGGTLEIESPGRYNAWALQLLRDIGVDLDRYKKTNETNGRLYESLGMRGSHFFDRETFGKDRLVVPPGSPSSGRHHAPFPAEYVRNFPISEQAKRDLLRLQDPDQPDYLPGLSSAQKKERLARMSYRDYLLDVAKVDKQAYWFYMAQGRGVFCVGADATPALFAWQMSGGKGGFQGLKLEESPDGLLADLPGGQHGRQKESGEDVHFPDGNATLARLLVRWLIPDALPGTTQEDLGTGRVNYSLLDRPSNTARIRLNSTVLNVRHDGDAASAKEVIVSYNSGGSLYEVRGRSCVMACWNMFIPYLVPDLSQKQREALAYNVKAPIVYTNVLLKNWQAFEKLGTSYVECPTMYHDTVALAEPADLGDLHHARNPGEPVAVRMTRMPGSIGLPKKEQHRIGRAELLATTFETFERNIRDQLARVLSPGGFDPARDIAGISVNRWPHGYSYTYNSLYDPMEWVFTETETRPCVVARQSYGLISIANSDAAASPHTDAAILEAHRAVEEVLEKRAYPFTTRGTASA